MGNPKVKNSKSLKDSFSSYCKHFLKMLYLLMMMIMMNCFYAIVDPRKRLALFLARTIVRNAHHRESLTCRGLGLNQRRTRV